MGLYHVVYMQRVHGRLLDFLAFDRQTHKNVAPATVFARFNVQVKKASSAKQRRAWQARAAAHGGKMGFGPNGEMLLVDGPMALSKHDLRAQLGGHTAALYGVSMGDGDDESDDGEDESDDLKMRRMLLAAGWV